MPLTFGEVKSIVAPYAGRSGKCSSAQETSLFAHQVMEYLLYSGSHDAVRKLCICAYRGCIVLPPEVQLPLKVRIDNQASEVWNKWYTFQAPTDGFERCWDAASVLKEDGGLTPLAYEIPKDDLVIGVLGTCDEQDAFLTVQGKDATGREIYTTYQGESITGEKLSIKKGEIRYGQVSFREITAVVKSKTNGYVALYAVDLKKKKEYFLSDYAPTEEKPLYKKYKLGIQDCPAIAHISMLCRVRLKDSYHDNELTLFDNRLAVVLGAQRLQAELNNNLEVAQYKRQATEDILEKEGGYKKTSGSPVAMFVPMSGGAIKNIVR